jgi:hypothetical protein
MVGFVYGGGAPSTRGRTGSVETQRGPVCFREDLGGRRCGVTDVRGAWKTEQDRSSVRVARDRAGSSAHGAVDRRMRASLRRRSQAHNATQAISGGEFDPGSGSTLAACLMHASRTGVASVASRGGRVRSAWLTCPAVGGSARKRAVIPHTLTGRVGRVRKGPSGSPVEGAAPD